ncbi:hypothetical protein [Candidatus Aalborgicola defluviihabitans]|uniref:hypothetical protein n=1 Tax=Candidatus Aalborgicola defluviihabitans TaxID=3386187 RepID=UPI0039B92172
MTLQVSRSGQSSSHGTGCDYSYLKQNIVLRPGDVITSFFNRLVLRCWAPLAKTKKSIFEAQGISIAQALAVRVDCRMFVQMPEAYFCFGLSPLTYWTFPSNQF